MLKTCQLLGLGEPESALFGLQLPIFNRILLVYSYEEIMHDVNALLSSKIQSRVLRLSDCLNYSHGMIDNTVCLGYTVDPVLDRNIVHHKLRDRLLVQRENCHLPLQDLQVFALALLAACMVLHTVENADALDRPNVIWPQGLKAKEVYGILHYHSDDVCTRFRTDWQEQIQTARAKKEKICKEYRQALYWAQDAETIYALFQRPPTNAFHHWIKDVYDAYFR